MHGKYFIHSPTDWHDEDINEIKAKLDKLGHIQDRSAAIGEGGGGAGFETVVELVLIPVATGLVSAAIWDVVKVLAKKRPRKKKLPSSLPKQLDMYRLVVHIQNNDKHTIVSVNLKEDISSTETAVKVKLEKKLNTNPWRMDQRGDDWDVIQL